MIAVKLISKNLLPLHASDTGEEALGAMNDFHVKHLPVVEDNHFLGILSEEEVLENDAEAPISTYPLRHIGVFVRATDHLYDVLRLVGIHQITIIPVLQENGAFLGLITLEDLLQAVAHLASFSEPGGVLVLEMARHDYTMAEVARIVESEDAVILSSFLSAGEEPAHIELTLKLNRQDLHRVIAALNRYGYEVKGSYTEKDYDETLKERYELLMSYLNV